MADLSGPIRDRPAYSSYYFRWKYGMTISKRSANEHPSRLASIVLVDGAIGTQHDYRRLTCYGAFEVEFLDGSPVFTSHHVSTTDNGKREAMLADLGGMSHDTHVLLGSSRAQTCFWDRGHILEDGLAYLHTISELEVVEPSNLTLMGAPEGAMVELGNKFGLRNSGREDVMGQARSAGVRAQLVWLAYVTSALNMKETRSMFAAFQAWQAIEKARPIPF